MSSIMGIKIRPVTEGTSYRTGHAANWKLSGACAGLDPSWWDLDGDKDTAGNKAARQVCRTCPFQRECLKSAFAEGAQGVMRGGRRFNERELAAGLRRCIREECQAEFVPQAGNAQLCSDACVDLRRNEQKTRSHYRDMRLPIEAVA